MVTDADLLAVLIGRGAKTSAAELASELLEDAGGLQGLGRLGARRIARLRGLGPVRAARIVVALELGARALHQKLACSEHLVGSFDAVVAWAHPRLAALEHEEVWLLCLDARNGLRHARCIARGGAHGCALTPGDVLRPAIREAASALVLVHNHPSGDPTPSADDFHMTRAVARAAEVVGIPLIDHVIVARAGAASVLSPPVAPPAAGQRSRMSPQNGADPPLSPPEPVLR